MGQIMKRRNVYIVLGLLTLILSYVLITAIKDARREAYISAARGQLFYISSTFHIYETMKGQSIFNAAREHNLSWRVLLSETFADDMMMGEYDDIMSQSTPYYLQNPQQPTLWETNSSALTSFRAIHFSAGYEDVDGKVAHWIIAFLPMKQDLWTSTETLSQAEFEKILPAHDTLLTPVYVVTESGKIMEANQLMTRLGSMK